jgi:hypothetical protein
MTKAMMIACRCEVLNVMSGDVARDYVRVHLQQTRTDGIGRPVHRCDQTEVEWVEEDSGSGYGQGVMLLRRLK